MSVLAIVVVVGVVVAAGVAYKLWKSGKAVTGGAVVAGVESEVVADVPKIENAVKTDVTAVENDVTKSS